MKFSWPLKSIFLLLLAGMPIIFCGVLKSDASSIEELKVKIDPLKNDNEVLQKFISFTHDADFLAREARRRLNFRASDEHVAFVYPSEEKTASSSADSSKEPFLAKIKNWLYDVFQK